MTEIYLDNSASTPPYPEVIELISRVQSETYANPSSMHQKGLAAEKLIGAARGQIAAVLGCPAQEIIFTSGGTEANNLAIRGAAAANRRRGNHLLTTVTEHPSVINCFRALEADGFTVSYAPVNGQGTVEPDEISSLVSENTILVSVMHINNEIGSIQPLREIGRLIRQVNPKVTFHVDAVQSFTRLPLEFKDWHADMISLSAHKLHGPKGAGCLWVRKGTQLRPLFEGGGQEKGLRSGTENVAALAGFGLAAKLSAEKQAAAMLEAGKLKKTLCRTLTESGIDFAVNGPAPENGAPHIINISFPGTRAEVLLHSLEAKGIYVSAGSACHSRRPEPSHVLTAIGLKGNRLESALRFSFSHMTSEQEIVSAGLETAKAVRQLGGLIK